MACVRRVYHTFENEMQRNDNDKEVQYFLIVSKQSSSNYKNGDFFYSILHLLF